MRFGPDDFTPGIVEPGLAPEPLGTEGQLTPGPDELRPSIPEERAELIERGYLSDRSEMEAEGADGDYSPEMPPLFGKPPGMSENAPFNSDAPMLPRF